MKQRVFIRIAIRVITTGFAIFFLGGCSVNIDTKPDAYPFPSEQVFGVRPGIVVNIKNFYTKPEVAELASLVFCDLQQFTDTALTIVHRELQMKGVKISPDTKKTVVLKMVYPSWVRGMWTMKGRVTLQAILGNGQLVTIDADNQTGGNAFRAFNGAILKAVTSLLKDEVFSAYLNE